MVLLRNVQVTSTGYEPEDQPWINQVNVVRTAESFSRFEGRFCYGPNNDFWQAAKDVNGTRTFLPDTQGVDLSTGLASGDAYYDITKAIFFYQPDTVVHAATALALTTETNVTKFWGLASYQSGAIQDGYLLRNANGTIEFVKVSSVTGTPVETTIARAAWDDPMDGTGPSGVTLDFSKVQMVEISHAWYGAGTATLQFRLQGKTYTAAHFNGANDSADYPIIANPSLSAIYGVEATAALGAAPSFSHWGLSVSVDGNKQETGRIFGTFADPVSVSGGTWVPVLSIRLKTTFAIDGATPVSNVYGYITDIVASASSGTRDSIIAIVRNPTLTGAVWGNIPDVTGTGVTDSMIEVDTTATAFTAGLIAYSRAVPDGQSLELDVFKDELIALDSLASSAPVITIAARPFTGGSANVGAAFSWREVY